MPDTPSAGDGPRVGLLVSCLVDLMRPAVGFATVKLLEDAGCRVSVPPNQTCCGQPAYNFGDLADARAIAGQIIDAFDGCDYVVAPSGSCAGTLCEDYPALFEDDRDRKRKALALAGRTHEITSFLHDVLQVEDIGAQYRGVVTYHDSCSGLRTLGIEQQPRALLGQVRGLELKECNTGEVCCGFGGSFSVEYPDISGRMVDNRVDDIIASGADTLLGGDLGCLLNIAGRLKRRGSAVRVRHVAEVLAGMTETPPIGEGPAAG